MVDPKIIKAHIHETGQSSFAVDISVSGHHWVGDESLEAGGKDLGPSPYETLLAALGECTAMTVRWYARGQNWPLERVEVNLTHRKENKQDHFTKQIILHGAALSREQRAKLIEIAAKCPVQRTLEGTPIIETI